MKVGDIRVVNNKPEICIQVDYYGDGKIATQWEDYEEHLLHTRMGMSSGNQHVHTLQHFIDVLNVNRPLKQKEPIKIRYAYISSPTNVKEDPFYHETLNFKAVTLKELETRKGTIGELITDDKAALTKILGRDRCTELKDMDGRDIYENDIVRWTLSGDKDYSEGLVDYCHSGLTMGTWYKRAFPNTERYSKVISNIYKDPNWEEKKE